MAKSKPPRGGLKKSAAGAPPEKITPRSFLGALPCLIIVLIGIGLFAMFFYASLTASLKSGVAK